MRSGEGHDGPTTKTGNCCSGKYFPQFVSISYGETEESERQRQQKTQKKIEVGCCVAGTKLQEQRINLRRRNKPNALECWSKTRGAIASSDAGLQGSKKNPCCLVVAEVLEFGIS